MDAWAASGTQTPGVENVAGLPLHVQTLILLGFALVFAPIFKKIGLGTVLGYLAAGVVIGPVLQIFTDGEQLLHFAELGIVFLLFIIGLELRPKRLLALRREIFGLGTLQLVLTSLAIGLICYLAGYFWKTSLMVGLGLALSSTAFGMQILNDRAEFNTSYGQKAFAILLFQDIALVPILAMIPFLVPQFLLEVSEVAPPTFSWWSFAQVAGAIGGLILVGHFFLNSLFRVIANTGAREMMIAVALFVVLGAAVLTQAAGLSMALGAFIAGVMLAESAYRHELEANIDPFRGLLLGLFFMAVGTSLDLQVLVKFWWVVLLAAPGIMIVKAIVIYAIARFFKSPHNEAVKIASLLPQVGEFGFVIFSAAAIAGVVSNELSSIITAIVTVTMALTPLSVFLGERLLIHQKAETIQEDYGDATGQAFIIGFGRFGQIVAQTMLAQGIKVTVIDNDPQQIRNAAKFGFRIFYGEGKRLEVLHAAGIHHAKAVAICSGGKNRTTEIVKLVKEHFPEIRVYARAYDRNHAVELSNLNVEFNVREMFESALKMGEAILHGMEVPKERARFITKDVRQRDLAKLIEQQTKGVLATSINDLAYHEPLAPEPLSQPKSEAEVYYPETETAKTEAK